MLHNGNTIYESLVTCEYIDEVFPGDFSIHADNASDRAKDRMMTELFNKVIMPQMRNGLTFLNLLFVNIVPHFRIMFGWRKGMNEEARSKHWKESLQNLEAFERELLERNSENKRFFSKEENPGWLDIMMWPWMERVDAYELVFKEPGCRFPRQEFPQITKWMERMMKTKLVSDYLLPVDIHAEFIKSVQSGDPSYNLLSSPQ